MLSYRELAPAASLAPFIRCFWILQGMHPGIPERILPDGRFELVFHRGDPFRRGDAIQPRAMLVGEIRRPTVVTPAGAADIVGVRFRAGGAAAFFDFSMHEARDLILPLQDAGSGLPATSDLPAIERFLARRLRPHRQARLVRAAVGDIRLYGGNIRLRELSARLGVTERTLERAFTETVGMGPKQFSRVIRFQSTLKSDDDLAYYDQSHRIHEFRAFAGVTPTEFRREQHAVNDAFVGNLQSSAESST